MKIRFAVAPFSRDPSAERYMELVDGLERLGFDTIWLSDIPLGTTFDPSTALALAAGRTTRLKLGTNLVPFGRNPYLLAKDLAQLDQLSAGRLLLMLVPGLGAPTERRVLGVEGVDRGRVMDDVISHLRTFWRGEPGDDVGSAFAGVTLPTLPVQDPLEIWLGGSGPRALERVGRLADGWLGAAMTVEEVAAAMPVMHAAATEAGRVLDAEHFGLSIPYARTEPDDAGIAALRTRRPDVDPSELLPVGAAALGDLLARLVDAGLSKFVLRPATTRDAAADVTAELEWLAEVVLPLQT